MATKSPTVTITGHAHVNILTSDVDRSVAFYTESLGFSILPRPDFGGFPGAWLEQGNTQIHLSHIDEMPERVGLPHFALLVPFDLYDETCEALEARGITWLAAPSSREDFGVTVRAAFIEDPDGNVIELTTMGAGV
jgi:catechol 2,3-dioxygenase-like lactoylglutathione lyase family enzyme